MEGKPVQRQLSSEPRPLGNLYRSRGICAVSSLSEFIKFSIKNDNEHAHDRHYVFYFLIQVSFLLLSLYLDLIYLED